MVGKLIRKGAVLGFIFCFYNVNIVFAQDEGSGDILKVDDNLPEFILNGENGVVKSEDLKGKVVMINFFATWCPPCRKELPHVQKDIWEKNKGDKDFVLLIVGREHSQQEITAFVKDQGFKMPFYPDEGRKVYSLFAKQTIPRNYIIDRNGKVIFAESGFSEDSFKKIIDILEQQLQ